MTQRLSSFLEPRPNFIFLPIALVALVAVAEPANAQDLSERWEVQGTYSITLGDDDIELFAVVDGETGNGTLSLNEYGGFKVIQVTGLAVGPEGQPGVPIITVTLGPFQGSVPEEISVEFREADRVLMASIDSGTTATLLSATLSDNGSLNFEFEGELAVMSPTADGGFEPATGAVATMISGSFSGELPLE